MSMVSRGIRVTITLGEGAFGDDPAGKDNTVTLEGLQVSATIQKGGLPSLDSAAVRIYGLDQSKVNKLSRVGVPFMQVRNNRITVDAGDDKDGYSQVFSGIIQTAFGDYQSPPDVALQVMAQAGILGLKKPVKPLSYPQGVKVGVVCAQIAASMDMSFINHGVDITLPPGSYFPGTAIDQLRAVERAAGINAQVTGGPVGDTANQNYVEIWPKGGTRGGRIPLVSPATGLVGYPQYSDLGVALTTLYEPGLAYGGRFNLDTSVEPARGLWNILQVTYELESETPNGAWFAHIVGTRTETGALG